MPITTGVSVNSCRKYEASIEDFNVAMQINPNSGEAYNNSGLSKIRLGLTNEGCDDFHKAYELGDKKSGKAIQKYCSKK